MEARMYREAGSTTYVSTRQGFTLAELLVVIAIIGVLMSMLIPAVTAARDSARRVDCGFKMGQLGKAVIQYDLAREGFPGYLELTGGYPTNWVIMTLPYLGRPDILNAWRDTTKTAFWGGVVGNTTYRLGAAMSVPLIKELVCPSDQPPEQCPLSYVANCGMADLSPASAMTTPPDWPANGPFHNHYYNNSTAAGNVPPAVQVRMSAADIKTGATFTLMLSENVQAGEWTDPYSPDTGLAYTTNAVTDYLAVQTLTGMVFSQSSSQLNPGVGSVPRHINDSIIRDSWSSTSTLVGSRPTPPTAAPPPGSASPAGYTYARPSSFHRGGVNVVYCDGHGQFLAQNVNPTVFAAMMTTDRANCRQPGTTATPTNNSDGLLPVRTYIFSNTDVGKN
jgi:prepilin-type N-terminal cleavage/methylation domain-containing protein/prepilin-type processing-associated H-X9-DG protein